MVGCLHAWLAGWELEIGGWGLDWLVAWGWRLVAGVGWLPACLLAWLAGWLAGSWKLTAGDWTGWWLGAGEWWLGTGLAGGLGLAGWQSTGNWQLAAWLPVWRLETGSWGLVAVGSWARAWLVGQLRLGFAWLG